MYENANNRCYNIRTVLLIIIINDILINKVFNLEIIR